MCLRRSMQRPRKWVKNRMFRNNIKSILHFRSLFEHFSFGYVYYFWHSDYNPFGVQKSAIEAYLMSPTHHGRARLRWAQSIERSPSRPVRMQSRVGNVMQCGAPFYATFTPLPRYCHGERKGVKVSSVKVSKMCGTYIAAPSGKCLIIYIIYIIYIIKYIY